MIGIVIFYSKKEINRFKLTYIKQYFKNKKIENKNNSNYLVSKSLQDHKVMLGKTSIMGYDYLLATQLSVWGLYIDSFLFHVLLSCTLLNSNQIIMYH